LSASDRLDDLKGSGIEGGEALAVSSTCHQAWYALWTQSHCEQLVDDQLRAKGFTTFLPTMRTWSRRRGVQRLIPVPMFSGYLFVGLAMDKAAYVEIAKTRGLVRILGERWDHLSPIPDDEIGALRALVASDLEVMPHAFLREGDRVRLDAGLLAGLEGILVRTKPKRGLFVLSVELLHRSVAVEVDCTLVTPIGAPGRPGRVPASGYANQAAW
jgi:transcription termination/antitermination protein NusG